MRDDWTVNWPGFFAWLKIGVGLCSKSAYFVGFDFESPAEGLVHLLLGLFFALDGLADLERVKAEQRRVGH